ncbi:hypothetical protein SAMN04488515_0681 [Cognatiyoonia koreensis]|uniref:Uncharacterized protein n=1 Tax=Cognatiyoonia koreensis TaxID=364200 RepID=A0A1I0NL91_9RHOB|nr:hypothetical protein [Cognatiyoonia koreensis]SEW01998.1 hypothetical protein SAMN04488515_0681 [Cognatiyoonia koreensis]
MNAIIILLVVAAFVAPYWIIWTRAGHHGAWSLFLLLPVTNLLVPYVLAFKRWPVEVKEKAKSDVFD